jgi:hypothetical protein
MKKSICLIVVLAIISLSQIMAQQYTAAGYWRMENDTAYKNLLKLQNAGDSLSLQDQGNLTAYKAKLADYFEKMSDSEKSLYYKYRANWNAKPGEVNKPPSQPEGNVYSGERSMYSQYLWSRGLFGFLYGGAAVYISGIESEEAIVAIPLLTAGASVLVPMFTMKDKYVTYNSLNLSLHGKTIGLLQGAALGVLIVGDNIEDGKLLLGLSTFSSIGLGHLGYKLGRDKPWSEGRVALYNYYGTIMPLEGLALVAAFNSEEPRLYAATSLVFGAGGYLIADRVANWNDFTKGDIRATQTLASLNGLLGLFIIVDKAEENDIKASAVLVPAIGTLGGTIAGHLWLKDARLTDQQGRNTAFASAAGVAIGLGLTAIFSPESATPYYLVSYLTGMSSYAYIVSKYKIANRMTTFEPKKLNNWDINLMPQNILLNRQLANFGTVDPRKRQNWLPAFYASVRF